MRGDFIVLKKTSNVSNGKGDTNEDEGNKGSHKKYGDKGKRSLIPPEMKIGKDNGLSKEKIVTNEDLEKSAFNVNESHRPKSVSTGGICPILEYQSNRFGFIIFTELFRIIKQFFLSDEKKEEDNLQQTDDIQSVSEESHQSHLTFDSYPALDKMQRRFDAKPTLVSKLLTETTDSQQSLSTNSPENFDEETAV